MTARRRGEHHRWQRYFNGRQGIDAFRIAGSTIAFQTTDLVVRRLLREHWGAFRVESTRLPRPDAVFRCSETPPAERLKSWHAYVTERFLFLSDGKRYFLTGYLRKRPWQIDCRPLAGWDPRFAYYHVIEPLMLDLLKRCGVLVWHGAAVARRGRAVLLSGVSGSGKSTTTLNLLGIGYRFIADDQVLLRARPRGVEVLGGERAVFLTERSMSLLPEWSRLRAGRRQKRGHEWKHRIDLARLRHDGTRPAIVGALLFPTVKRTRDSWLERLTPAAALVECLRQPPKEFPATILPAAVDRQFDVYSELVRTTPAYRLYLGSDQESVRATLAGLR